MSHAAGRIAAAVLLVTVLLGGCDRTPPKPAAPSHAAPMASAGQPAPSPAASPSVDPLAGAKVGLGKAPQATAAPARNDLAEPRKKEVAMELVSSAENSSLDWRAQYRYIEDIGDGRGYTAGIVGFCSGTGDMLSLVQRYTVMKPGNRLAGYLPALRRLQGSDGHDGLDPGFTGDWVTAAADPVFQQAQDAERDSMYFLPALAAARQDGLRPLGQFAYFDAIVMHGADGLAKLREKTAATAQPPARGGAEAAYLNAFLDARDALMRSEAAHHNTTRVDTEQRRFLEAGNLDLATPLTWQVYGTTYTIN